MILKKNSRLTHKQRIQIETLLNENIIDNVLSKAYKILANSRVKIKYFK